MSKISYCSRESRFNSSYGNYDPPEYTDYLECDRHTSEEQEDHTFYVIPWKKDFHVCEDCIDDFLDDTANDCLNLETFEYTCPDCDAVIFGKDLFIFHLMNEHIEEEEI